MAGDNMTEETSGTVKMRQRNAKKERKMMLEAFMVAMKEDLAEWLSSLMKTSIDAKDFMAIVENGVVLCRGANIIQTAAETYIRSHPKSKAKVPEKGVHFTTRGATSGSFVARDNVANFITWCRALGIVEAIIFESEDLVLHKNEKSVILTLLDVARKANKFGVKPPEIVVLEEEIERELELDRKRELAGQVERTLVLEKDNNLDDLVKDVVDQCSCHSKFPVKKLADGKYKVGNQKTLIFVRVMRNHVMVRVGGGWDTLTHYVEKHDPCRVQVAGEIDGSGKCGQKFHSQSSPLRVKKTSTDHTWDDESVCSTESSGSNGTQSSGSMGDPLSDRSSLRGNEVANAHGAHCSHTASSPRSTRRSTMPSSRSPRQEKQQNGHTVNTQHWVQNHVDGPTYSQHQTSPRSRSNTAAAKSPATPRRSNINRNNNFKQAPALFSPRKPDGRSQTLSHQGDRSRLSSIPLPINRQLDVSGNSRPSFFKSRTMDICGSKDSTDRRRTATYSANGMKSGGRLSMVGRREKSMDAIVVRQTASSIARRRAIDSQMVNNNSPSVNRKLATKSLTRDCRVTDATRSRMQPRSAVFTV